MGRFHISHYYSLDLACIRNVRGKVIAEIKSPHQAHPGYPIGQAHTIENGLLAGGALPRDLLAKPAAHPDKPGNISVLPLATGTIDSHLPTSRKGLIV